MQELPSVKSIEKPQVKPKGALDEVKNIIAISSGKGGVGKSTVSVNLAVTLAKQGYKVGLMDADVYGPSVAKMLDGQTQPLEQAGKILPIERHGVHFMSMAVLTNEDSPVIWRGPMASKLIQTFLTQVMWGQLDYLLIDLPPGTGDIQLTLTQAAPLTGAIIVTTPQEVATSVTMRGIKMFDQVKVPILGVVENMSGYVCGHCGEETPIFRKGGGEKTAKEMGLHFLGRIPIDPQLALMGDLGTPAPESQKNSLSQQAIGQIAQAALKRTEEVKHQSGSDDQQLPEKIELRDGKLWVLWPEDEDIMYDSFELRYLCPCAECVDENTGKRMIQRSKVPADVHAKSFKPVGHYGVQITWSDNHSTGIYTYERLRNL